MPYTESGGKVLVFKEGDGESSSVTGVLDVLNKALESCQLC